MQIFVAGATGVIGRRLVPLLLDGGHSVTAVARSAERRAHLERLGARPVQVDLFDAAGVRSAVAGHDVVINLATHIPPPSKAFFPGAWRENDRIRREASRIIADAAIAAGASRLIQESFAGSYPDRGDQWIDERTPVHPAKHTRSTLDAEREADRFTREGRIGIILRFALFYGPDSPHMRDTIAFVRKGKAPTFGRPDGFISSVSMDDAAAAVAGALTVPSGVYNIVDDRPLTRQEYFESLAAALGVGMPWLPPPWMAKLAGSLGETIARSLRLSNAKFKGASGWAPRYPSVVEGWPAMIDGATAEGRHDRDAAHAAR